MTDKNKDPFPMMNKSDIKAKSQPHFTLLAKDNFTPILLREWIAFAEQNECGAAKINEAKKILTNIEEWRRMNPLACKMPD